MVYDSYKDGTNIFRLYSNSPYYFKFPLVILLWVIKLFSFKGDIVLDPFNGARTTTVVAKRLGRKYDCRNAKKG